MEFDYRKLRGKIREVCGSEFKFASLMPMARSTLSLKFNNMTEFSQSEIMTAMKILNLPVSSVDEYFFTLKFGNTNE